MVGKIFFNKNKEIIYKELPSKAFTKEVSSEFRVQQKKEGNSEFLFTNDFLIYVVENLLSNNINIIKIETYPNDSNDYNVNEYLKRSMTSKEQKALLKILSNRDIVENVDMINFFYEKENIEMNNQGIIAGDNLEIFLEQFLKDIIKDYCNE
ncbi:hypothetical protein QM894_02455 [Streptococcus cristatus]|jgi:hypothetical protein|uniref:hypothetical protein n=1 Tax=Streptococcus TaxID=1301 RepID=UPI002559EDE4|nr:hypothetical protein [Streptococcus sp. SC1]MDL2431655.1 hypothetical protein [Streptococcus sp. SC1]